MTNVIAFPTPEPDTFDQAWDLLPQTMKRRSESRKKLKPLWDKSAKDLGGQTELLARLQTYLREDKDLPKSGGPGLQVLLRSGRLENWAPKQTTTEPAKQFPNEAVRTALLSRCGADWVASYLDPCELEGTTVIVRTEYAVKKLKEHGHVFRMAGFTGMRKRV